MSFPIFDPPVLWLVAWPLYGRAGQTLGQEVQALHRGENIRGAPPTPGAPVPLGPWEEARGGHPSESDQNRLAVCPASCAVPVHTCGPRVTDSGPSTLKVDDTRSS